MIINKKNTGSFYTPQLLADYITYRLFQEDYKGKRIYQFEGKGTLEVLEPSVGGGFFLDSLLDGNYFEDIDINPLDKRNVPYLNITAVEIDGVAAKNLEQKKRGYGVQRGKILVRNEDYLKFFLNSTKKYDLIIGNPPYVRRRNMSLETRELCAKVHKMTGMRDKKPKNLWTSFFAAAKESLKEKGVIAFVLPTDLLQVKYPEQIREILNTEFDKVEIFTHNWSAFRQYDDVEQDVVTLICSNGYGKSEDILYYHIDSKEDLQKPKHTPDFNNSNRLHLNKWTNYVLTPEEFSFLDEVRDRISPMQVKEICDSGAGIVTAANDFFIVSKDIRDKYQLDSIAKYTIKKSSSMFPALVLETSDLEKKASEGAEVYFIHLPDETKSKLSQNYVRYIDEGESSGLHLRYKMLLRDNWYAVPSVWKSEAFFTKRANIFPRIVVNNADAYVTDAFYRIVMRDGYDATKLAFSFFNTLTLIFGELEGRYYGGGVLELTPNEFKRVEVPYIYSITSTQARKLDQLLRKKTELGLVLDYTDKLVLRPRGVTDAEIAKLRAIYEKLLKRRLKKQYELNGKRKS